MTIISATNYLEGATSTTTGAADAASSDTTSVLTISGTAAFITFALPATVASAEGLTLAILGDNLSGWTLAAAETSSGTRHIIENQKVGDTNRLMATTTSAFTSLSRITISMANTTATDSTIRQLWLGDRIALPRGASAPYTPPNLGLDQTPKRSVRRSEEGYYLGQQNVRAPTMLRLQYPNIASAWIEDNWATAHERLQGDTIWIAPDSDQLGQCAYAWAAPKDGNPTPPKLTAPNVYSLSLDLVIHP